jgi:hypothetical protein
MITNINSYLLSSKPYLFGCQEYDNIVTINLFPKGPLGKIVRKINLSNNMTKLSGFTDYNSGNRYRSGGCGGWSGLGGNCGYALLSLNNIGYGGIGGGGNYNCRRENLMTANEIPNLFSFLLSNGYKIDTSLTKMMNNSNIQIDTNNIIAFITYNE